MDVPRIGAAADHVLSACSCPAEPPGSRTLARGARRNAMPVRIGLPSYRIDAATRLPLPLRRPARAFEIHRSDIEQGKLAAHRSPRRPAGMPETTARVAASPTPRPAWGRRPRRQPCRRRDRENERFRSGEEIAEITRCPPREELRTNADVCIVTAPPSRPSTLATASAAAHQQRREERGVTRKRKGSRPIVVEQRPPGSRACADLAANAAPERRRAYPGSAAELAPRIRADRTARKFRHRTASRDRGLEREDHASRNEIRAPLGKPSAPARSA